MFKIVDLTEDITEPVTVEELANHLRLNTHDEDELLSSFITTARMQFEHLTQRAVVPHTYRQYVQSFDDNSIWLMRGDVTEITSVSIIDPDGVTQEDETYDHDLTFNPARVWWINSPNVSSTSNHIAYVEFEAGFEVVPVDITVAIKLLAAHYFEQRAAFVVDNMKELPFGFTVIAKKYALNLSGTWSM